MYNFIDVTESQSSSQLPSEALWMNGIYIEHEIEGYQTLYVSGREVLENEIEELQIGKSDGSRFRSKRYSGRTIVVGYLLYAKTNEAFRKAYNKLNAILDTAEVKLIFNDELDKYFIGTKRGIGDVPPGVNRVTGEIEFFCADPFKYSETMKSSRNNGSRLITLVNNGTQAIPINLKATMKSENGYLGYTLADRFYQIGNPGEVDGVQKERTELLFNDHFAQDKGWLLNQGVTPPVTNECLQTGAIAYRKESDNEGFAYVTDYKIGNSWHGAALTKIVPADSQGRYPVNWRSEWRFDMNTDGAQNKGAQIGHNSVTFSDANDQIICSVVFEDNNPVNERSDMAVYIDGKRVWDTRETTSFYVTGRGGNGPVVIVEKISNQITVSFSYGGVKKTFITGKGSAELRKVTWYCAAYKTYIPINNNNIRAINLRKHNVQYWEDIPNFLGSGDVVELDSGKNELYINDIKNWDRVDIGSQPLLLPPGQHTLGISVSEWAQMPEVEVTYRERWL